MVSVGFPGLELEIVFVDGASEQLRHFFEAVESTFEEAVVLVRAAGVELGAVGMGGHSSQAG